MKIIVPGGAGYVGSMLVPQLLAEGHRVTVYDTLWLGDGCLPKSNEHLRIIKADVRNHNHFADACKGKDAVIYLASISNNAMAEINYKLFNEVNCGAFAWNLRDAKKAGVKRFIYASSVAGYARENATEDDTLLPLTHYALSKAAAEETIRQHQSQEFACTIVRAASVCGYSVHQRFDLTVNMMAYAACRKGIVKVNGGEQKRSHIHIRDLCEFYKLLLAKRQHVVAGQTFNAVAESESIQATAEQVITETGAVIIAGPATDPRSYTASGEKAARILGWKPQWTVADAVRDLEARLDAGQWEDAETNETYMNIRRDLS